eukprot:8658793-Alexandrium_andersonii.AAC.1
MPFHFGRWPTLRERCRDILSASGTARPVTPKCGRFLMYRDRCTKHAWGGDNADDPPQNCAKATLCG